MSSSFRHFLNMIRTDATPPSPSITRIFSANGVFGCKLMAVLALGFSCVLCWRSISDKDVFSIRDSSQVLRINAVSHSTYMINYQATRNLAVIKLEEEFVCRNYFIEESQETVSLGCNSSLPIPAFICALNSSENGALDYSHGATDTLIFVRCKGVLNG